MASTKQQNLTSQSSLSGLQSENETQSATTMAFPKNETPRFESFPPEIRNIVYRHLFPPLCKRSRPHMIDLKRPDMWGGLQTYIHHDAYIYHTAILRSNRLIGQEATSALYGGNMFVLFNLAVINRAYHMALDILIGIAWNTVRKSAPVPSRVVQIDHRIEGGKPAEFSFIVAAADVNVICKNIIDNMLYCYEPKAAYFLVALPQLGWQHERLLTMIWFPLKALREGRCIDFLGEDFYPFKTLIKVTDCTGVFKEADEMYEPKDSESGSLSEPSRENDAEKDESDGSGSEGSKNGDHDSCDVEEEDEEEDIEEVDRTSNDSDDVAHEESEDDEANTSGESSEGDSDEATSSKSHEHCNNNPRAKPIPCKASISNQDADANAQNTIFDNYVTQG